MSSRGPHRVLIVDDSAVVRQALSDILNADPQLEVMGTAADPYLAAAKIKHEVPDVITLDVEMPRMDGLTFLKTLMRQYPIPVVVVSSLSSKGTKTALRALELGAVDVLTKPHLQGVRAFIEEEQDRFRQTVRAAAQARLTPPARPHPVPKRPKPAPSKAKPVAPLPDRPQQKYNADAVIPWPGKRRSLTATTEQIVLLGASTGGTEAIFQVVSQLPANSPGLVIVQHMPEHFTRSFAERLNQHSAMTVTEARHQDSVVPGHCYIAPGNRHTLLRRSGARYYLEVIDGPLVNRHRPSVDVLFRSGAIYAGPNARGILMTGMGDDGAQGLLELRQMGALTAAQDEKTSVVFGMPKEAIQRGAARHVLALNQIPGFIQRRH